MCTSFDELKISVLVFVYLNDHLLSSPDRKKMQSSIQLFVLAFVEIVQLSCSLHQQLSQAAAAAAAASSSSFLGFACTATQIIKNTCEIKLRDSKVPHTHNNQMNSLFFLLFLSKSSKTINAKVSNTRSVMKE